MKRRTQPVLEKHPERVAEVGRQFAALHQKPESVSYNPSDLGNARRLVAAHGEDLRFCAVLGKWFVWDETLWREDTTGEVTRRAKQTVEAIGEEAQVAESSGQRQDLERWALRSEAAARIRDMIRLAESETKLVVRPEQLDADPWLLNCSNGLLDLRTGKLQSHRRDALCTRQAGALYDPQAECPAWLRFLDRIMAGNKGRQAFLQRAVGYALTGDMSEQVLFVLHGTGANGKSTFLETIRAVLGNYARHTSFSTFLISENSALRNDLARLAGARLVTAAEVEAGGRLSEAVVKQITGGDTITVRFLYREFFEYRPHFKVFLAVNHKPEVRGTEHAIWRRIHLIPFTVTIPEDEQDRSLAPKLRPELPGILRWAVEGCRAWQEPGLQPPEDVQAATAAYREEMDVLGGFLEGCCVKESGSVTPAKELYAAYRRCCEENGEKPLTQTKFGMHLAERGFRRTRYGKQRAHAWEGIRLAPQLPAKDTSESGR